MQYGELCPAVFPVKRMPFEELRRRRGAASHPEEDACRPARALELIPNNQSKT